jgi:RNA polymerase sigma-70 factor (ECF subfamily)
MSTARGSEPSSVGDLAALTQAWDAHSGKLLAMIRRRVQFPLRTGEEAEDILQTVFQAAHRRWPAYRQNPPAGPYVWLYGLARDQVIETFRSQGRARSEPWPAESALVPPDGHTGPMTAAQRAERAELVRRVVASLSEQDREVLGMRYLDGLKPAEIADLLRLKPNTVYKREFDALQRFKSAWRALTGPRDSSVEPGT